MADTQPCPTHRSGVHVTATERHGRALECSTKHCTLQAGHPGDHEPTELEVILDVLFRHSAQAGVMASPTHWAYRGEWIFDSTGKPWRPDRNQETESPGHWFASCGVGNGDPGCGWDSEPTTFETKQGAREAAMRHVAEAIQEALS